MREKEILLRQVADIQGGENRRILLDLKAVLEEVQTEVRREEEKRSDLQLLYSKDRCAWELEKADLKCRIAQLESRDGVSAAGPPPPLRCETSSLWRERAEQKRLLVDTHTAAMDLRCRLDHSEKGWVKERSELLERFDSERKEWESQLRDMQRKIEELYSEVRARREGDGGRGGEGRTRDEADLAERRGAHAASHASSLFSNQSRRFSHSDSSRSSQSEVLMPLTPVLSRGGRTPRCRANSFEEIPLGGHFARGVAVDPERGGRPEAVAPRTSPKRNVDKSDNNAAAPRGPSGVPMAAPQTAGMTDYGTGSEKKKNTTALNAALKEIARVSEELCSYQDEVRKKPGGKRTDSYFSEENERLFGPFKSRLEIEESPRDLNQIYDDLRALERENWNSWSPVNTLAVRSNATESESQAPPVPPRVSSWYRSSPTPQEHEVVPQVPESFAVRKCHSPCPVVDRKSSSPSIVRKFEAMLQENEGKVLTGRGLANCPVPANSKCNAGCCHNRWSFGGNRLPKPSSNVPVQKSLSECNILDIGKHRSSPGSVGGPSPVTEDMPVDLLLPSLDLELPWAHRSLQGSSRNLLLEQKTSEFNRTLFQAEMGRGLEDAAGGRPVAAATPPPSAGAARRDATFDLVSQCTEATSDGRACPSALSPPLQEVEVGRADQRSARKSHEVERQEVAPPDLSPQLRLGEGAFPASQSPPRRPAPSRGASVPSPAERSSTVHLPSSLSPPHCDHGQWERPHTAQAPPARQPTPELGSRHPGHSRPSAAPSTQPDPPRPGPRVLADHPWKPLTLAAYPRPAEARSNYGAVERILKSYEESAAWAQQNQENQARNRNRSPSPSPRQHGGQPNPSLNYQRHPEELVGLLDMLDMDPPTSLLPGTRPTHTSSFSRSSWSHTHSPSHTDHLQTSVAHGTTGPTVEVGEASSSVVSSSSSSAQKNFSRPACPANRRLPSRWASRSSSSFCTSSSPSPTPVTQPYVSPQTKHAPSAFASYSLTYQMETVIV